jgi:hypothetical protein
MSWPVTAGCRLLHHSVRRLHHLRHQWLHHLRHHLRHHRLTKRLNQRHPRLRNGHDWLTDRHLRLSAWEDHRRLHSLLTWHWYGKAHRRSKRRRHTRGWWSNEHRQRRRSGIRCRHQWNRHSEAVVKCDGAKRERQGWTRFQTRTLLGRSTRFKGRQSAALSSNQAHIPSPR